ncbi:hypothetical protein CDAR_77671, partial [Caerostris darwini]
MQCMRQQRSRKRKLLFMVAISFLSTGDASDLAWWQPQATILEKLQMRKTTQCINSTVEKGNCSLCWRFLSCALMMLMVWHGGSRELLTWRNFRRGANTMHEQLQ